MEKDLSEDPTRVQLDAPLRHFSCSPRSPIDSPGTLNRAAHWVKSRLQEAGCRVDMDPVPFRGGSFENVYGTLEASVPVPGLPLVVAAHHDSAPGSPDILGLGGLAVLLETARKLAQTRPRIPVVFASYTLRNWGMAGSFHHAMRLRENSAGILGVINLDSVGNVLHRPLPAAGHRRVPRLLAPFSPRRSPRNTGLLSVVGNFASRTLLRRVVQALRQEVGQNGTGTKQKENRARINALTLPGRGFLMPQMRVGDHTPFWDAGFPSVMVTDTTSLRNPDAFETHEGSGGPEAPDLAFLEEVTRGVLSVVRNLSNNRKLEQSGVSGA